MNIEDKLTKYVSEAKNVFPVRLYNADPGLKKHISFEMMKVPKVCVFCESFIDKGSDDDNECGNGKVYEIVKEFRGEPPKGIMTMRNHTCKFWKELEE